MTSYQESDTSHQPRGGEHSPGCLVPAITAVISLALLVTLGSWLWIDGPEEAASADTNRTAVDVEDDHRPEGTSDAALLEVVRSAGWEQAGQPEESSPGEFRRTTYQFRRDDAHIRLVIYDFDSEETAREQVSEVPPPHRAIRFDDRLAIVEPPDDQMDQDVDRVADRLGRLRNLLNSE